MHLALEFRIVNNEPDNESKKDKPYECETQDDKPDDFQPHEKKAKKKRLDGSIWETDRSEQADSKWKRLDNKRDYSNDRGRESVRPDGSVR